MGQPDLARIGADVRRARTRRGLGKTPAARLAGISPITWTRVEDGRPVRDAKLAAVLDVVGLLDDPGAPPLAGDDVAYIVRNLTRASSTTIRAMRAVLEADLRGRG